MGNDTAQGWGVCSWLATIDYYCHASHYFDFSSDGEEGDGRKVYPRLATLATVEEEDVPNEERTS